MESGLQVALTPVFTIAGVWAICLQFSSGTYSEPVRIAQHVEAVVMSTRVGSVGTKRIWLSSTGAPNICFRR